MKHPHRADQIAAPLDQFEHVRLGGAVDIRMPPILDRSPITGFSNGENLKSQLSKASKSTARIHRDLMPPPKNQPAKLRINLRNQRALMSRIRSIERRHCGRIATLPRSFPNLNATARGHGDNLTRPDEEGKRYARTFRKANTPPRNQPAIKGQSRACGLQQKMVETSSCCSTGTRANATRKLSPSD
jgi:hypothetical protein